MKKIITLMMIMCFSSVVLASSRVDLSLEADRESRIEEINKLVLQINQAEQELSNFRFELGRVEANSSVLDHHVLMRNVAGAVAAIGLCSTLIYHTKNIKPKIFMLVGGYTISAISSIVLAIEHNGVKLSLKEINDVKLSIIKLEKIIAIEKKNLEKEISLLS
jgi:hypothetical protein